MHRLGIYTATMALLLSATPAAGDKPPANSKPLSEIAAALEKAGYAPIEEASFEDGRWEIEAYQKDTKFELRVDPMTGEVTSKRVDH
ncbi:MAG: PepSY domain-containing protein [Candidatus Binatia bacterium]